MITPRIQYYHISRHEHHRPSIGSVFALFSRSPSDHSLQSERIRRRRHPKLPQVFLSFMQCLISQLISKLIPSGNEFDQVLLIMRHGNSLLLVIIGTTLHAVVNFCSVIVSFYVVCRFEQV